MNKILQAYHYSKEYHTLIFYLWNTEGFIKWQIPLVMHAGRVYRATNVEQRGWLNKRIDLTVRNKEGSIRVFRLFFRDFRAEYADDISQFFVVVKLLAAMPPEFLPDEIAFGVMESPNTPGL